jgi:hypothetical protein
MAVATTTMMSMVRPAQARFWADRPATSSCQGFEIRKSTTWWQGCQYRKCKLDVSDIDAYQEESMGARNDDVINQVAAGKGFILSGSVTRL